MRVGIDVRIFSAKFRAARLAQGLSQKALAELANIPTANVTAMERLRFIGGGVVNVERKLRRVAEVLECPFEELFPPDYLELLAKNLLPRTRAAWVWVREVSLDALPRAEDLLFLPSAAVADEAMDELLTEERARLLPPAVRDLVSMLPERLQRVISMRFGLDGNPPMPLRAVGDAMGIH